MEECGEIYYPYDCGATYKGYLKYYVDKIREKAGKNMFAVAEYWHADLRRLLRYLDSVENCMSLFDVPLHYNLYRASISNGEFNMSSIFEGTLVEN